MARSLLVVTILVGMVVLAAACVLDAPNEPATAAVTAASRAADACGDGQNPDSGFFPDSQECLLVTPSEATDGGANGGQNATC